ncbi:sigma-54 interaction domain-containing protein [Garciella nitratireducens]|uniref:sigma-54 interaction domain-containing protein n=1 Tax=Garciella nitratireducens TaxID=218205 RepID=UPI000DE8BA1B|nr:sigma 54-interacting transcriptional regulator [Garciella nitratireducens]RBP44025.1 transcriptional regulator of aroF, aroG, tyrA and aromatic amino acid transport [Garciella nitratireducens]
MENKKIKFLVLENRIGIAKKIVDILTLKNINIIKMEINPPYISVELQGQQKFLDGFNNWIQEEIEEIKEIIEMDMLDFERRGKELEIIINSMNVGIIAVGRVGEILYYNSMAAELFSIIPEDVNKNIQNIVPNFIYDFINNQKNRNESIEFSQNIRGKEVNLVIDIKSIEDEKKKKIGALLVLREMEEVKKLMQSITRPSMNTFEEIIGESKIMKNTKKLAKSVATTKSNIMILGESGTGKELFARAIHLNSCRGEGPFVAVNCSAVPDALIESEFFGYEKGAFTGARNSGKQGLFELAKGGSIFLDEIGELPLHLQPKILRVIQEKKIRRIGGQKEIDIDVRIISATHRDLEKMIQEGTFREDLYYRLNVIPIHIPPLRERKEDIPIFVKYFINILGKDIGKENIQITQKALNKLINYDWPGNVRELQNVLERAIIFSKEKIDIENIMLQNKESPKLKKKGTNNKEDIHFPINLPEMIKNIEYEYIKKASEKFNSSREMARALGISHTTVINKQKQYGILL